MIENTNKDQLTNADTASEWNEAPQSHQESNSTHFSTTSSHESPIEGLQEQVTRVQTLLERNALSLHQLQNSWQLANYIEETQTEVQILRKKNVQQLALVKSGFDQGISNFLKKVQWWKREQNKCKVESQRQTKESIQDLKATKASAQEVLSDELRQICVQCRDATASLSRDVHDWKRESQLGRQKLLGRLENIAGSLDGTLQQERARCNQYESIVVGLLERTCEQGERFLRRIC